MNGFPSNSTTSNVFAMLSEPFPAAPREFGKRTTTPTVDDLAVFMPMGMDPEYRHPAKLFDVFVMDRNNPLVTGWHHLSTEQSASWAWTMQRYIRAKRPWLCVKVWSKPRYT